MKVYNTNKTELLNESELDYTLGRLEKDKLVIDHHEATEAISAKTVAQQIAECRENNQEIEYINGTYYKIHKYPNGGKDATPIVDIPAKPAMEAYDDYEDIYIYVPYTADELLAIENNKRHAELKAELVKIKEDIEQEAFGLVRDDYAEKKARAAEIINELRVLEGKEPREIMEVI